MGFSQRLFIVDVSLFPLHHGFQCKRPVPQPFRWCKPAGSLFLLLALSCFVTIARPGQRLDGEAGRKGGISEGIVAHAAERGQRKPTRHGGKPDWVNLRRFLFTVLPPWLVVSLLAIHYGHFLWIKKAGKLLLTLLATMTVIAFVSSGAIAWALVVLGFRSQGRLNFYSLLARLWVGPLFPCGS